MTRPLVLLCALALFTTADAATRARYGGSLRLGTPTAPTTTDPALADTPLDAALLSLATQGLCRIDASGDAHPVLASGLVERSPTQLEVSLRDVVRLPEGAALGGRELLHSWARLSSRDSPSPYRALLFPLRNEGRSFAGVLTAGGKLELRLAFAWPDLAASLCHPALAPAVVRSGGWLGVGPFVRAEQGPWRAHLGFTDGRPFVDALAPETGDDRRMSRQLASKQLDVWVGGAGTETPLKAPARFATYLAFSPERTGPGFREIFEAAIDRADLIRFFVPGPAEAMPALLPSAYGPLARTPVAGAGRGSTARELKLAFDASLEDQRAVAERIQVKLHDRGYRVVLEPLPRIAVRARWAKGDFDLMLQQILLPTPPAAALAVVLELAGEHRRLASELPPLGAIADATERAERARARAAALAPELPLIPLYARAPRTVVAPGVHGLAVDAFGLPRLEDAFLAQD